MNRFTLKGILRLTNNIQPPSMLLLPGRSQCNSVLIIKANENKNVLDIFPTNHMAYYLTENGSKLSKDIFFKSWDFNVVTLYSKHFPSEHFVTLSIYAFV